MSLVTIKRRIILVFQNVAGQRFDTWPLTETEAERSIGNLARGGCRLLYIVRCQPRRRRS